ncbi:MAG: ADP-forming succinate--CoA ligase subunit beta [Deltaproteobacteria bacterium]|nr:ADP-forming succinate--CoA ligase subunit beta [Deltaproteobacteria bacterium]
MKIHEYQAKGILKEFGVPVPRGILAATPDEAEKAARELGAAVCVVKAQIHAGGRGKGGGIKIAKSPAEARSLAEKMLSSKLATPQTGASGKTVRKVYIEEGLNIARELYLGAVIDRDTRKIVIMASSEGGMEIEEVAAKNPEKILKEYIDPAVGIRPFNVRNLVFGLGFGKDMIDKTAGFVNGVYNAFAGKDASLVEINPLVLTKEGNLVALDAKMNFDDNALFRHPEIMELRDVGEEESSEVEASKYDLSYIKLDGTIGNLVNGAGLAMATMDIIKFFGGDPANFLDVGGSATVEKVTQAFRIILRDRVDAILVNIFGGIMKCDVIAAGIVAAAKDTELKVPLVVRLSGTNVDMGKRIIAESGLKIISADTMKEAAEKVVAASKGKFSY